MKSNVVYYILLLLDSENTVRIPGLGVLTRRVQSAKISTKDWLVKPPHATVDFLASGKDKGKLLSRYISYKSGTDHDVAEGYVGEFTETVKSSLRESGRLSIDHLGTFFQKGDNIYFTADTATANAAYYGLKTVGLPGRIAELDQEVDASGSDVEVAVSVVTPIVDAMGIAPEVPAEVIPEPPAEQMVEEQTLELIPDTQLPTNGNTQSEDVPVPISHTSKTRTRVPLVLPIFLAIFLGVTALAIMQYNKRGALYHPAATYNRAPVQDNPLFGSGKEEKKDVVVPTDEIKPASDEERTLPEVLSENALGILGLDQKEEQAGQNPVEETVQSPAEENGSVEDMITEESDSPKENQAQEKSEPLEGQASIPEGDSGEASSTRDDVIVNEPIANKPVSAAALEENLTSDCYVIVGAFGVQSNVDRMLARLSDMGYAPASMSRRNLTQIGVPAPCGSEEIQRVLTDLQLNVEAEAWIYNR